MNLVTPGTISRKQQAESALNTGIWVTCNDASKIAMLNGIFDSSFLVVHRWISAGRHAVQPTLVSRMASA
jgi:hypothetical protein